MANIRDIKRRIKSVKSTQQITKAMKVVSAAKLKKAQGSLLAARPYTDNLIGILAHLTSNIQGYDHPLMEKRDVKKVGYVVVAGDRGLCGGFNVNVLRLAEEQIKANEISSEAVCVGGKGSGFLNYRGVTVAREFVNIGDNPAFVQAKELARLVMEMYLDGTFDEIKLVYTRFNSVISQEAKLYHLLPVQAGEHEVEQKQEYVFEPSQDLIMNRILPAYIENVLYRALLESKASEHGARMTAMSSATDNAEDMIERMTLSMNRARQAAITTEIAEIVSGAAALE